MRGSACDCGPEFRTEALSDGEGNLVGECTKCGTAYVLRPAPRNDPDAVLTYGEIAEMYGVDYEDVVRRVGEIRAARAAELEAANRREDGPTS